MSVRHSSIRRIWNKTLLNNIPSSLKLNILDNIHKSSKILDIGCGNGDDLLALREQGFTELFGIDVNRELVKSTKKLLGKNINISVQDATNLKFSDECFDYAIAKALLTVLVSDTSIKKCLREAYRVLKLGGILQIEDFFQNWHLELYRDRYLKYSKELGVKCTFPVYDSQNNLKYYARHFNVMDISILLIKVGFNIEKIEFKEVKTQSGNKVIGFTIVAKK